MSDVAVNFYTTTRAAWDALIADIRQAKVSIDIEQYIFVPDAAGSKFLHALREKAAEGVKIRLLCDTVGSYTFYRSPIPDELRAAGIEVRFFNPIRPWRIRFFTANFFRDHRKLMVVDSHIGHIGGAGIDADMADWRDTHLRLAGPIASDIRANFEAVWKSLHKRIFIKLPRPNPFIRHFTLMTNSPSIRLRQRFLYQAIIAAIRNAKQTVYLTTPYFIPDRRLYRVLRLAGKRGVDVRLIVPQVADHLFVNHARESYFTLALRAGIRIYVYKSVMMHAKTAIVDDVWATAGSFNLDSLSFLFNHEANVTSDSPGFVAALKEHFIQDLDHCEEITYEKWIKRPLRKKFLELLTWPFHGLM